jgi:hypothetical protein
MANVDFRQGLRPIGHLLGLNWNSNLQKCYIPSTDTSIGVFVGDAVDLAGSSDATGAYPTVTRVTTGASNPIYGVVVGIEPDPSVGLNITYRQNSTSRYVWVIRDPFVIYEIQGCSSAVITAASVGLNAVLVATHTGNTTTGLSGLELDSGAGTAPAADSTYTLTIMGCSDDPKNDITAVNAKWHVMINLHRLMPNWSPTDAAYFGSKGA